MARNSPLRIFCYDISCDRRRRKVASVLEDHATRVQFSVFEARMTPAAVNRLVRQIAALLAEHDSLRLYTVGTSGEKHCQVFGSGIPIESETGFWLL